MRQAITSQTVSTPALSTEVVTGGYGIPAKRLLLNPFITAATPLLTLLTQLRHQTQVADATKLRQHIINEIKAFAQKLTKWEYPQRIILAAQYCLCTALDEAVLNTTWGAHSIWVQQSLLSLFHRETWGGERFYIILESAVKDPRQNIFLIELLYLLLCLGFEGKFFDKNKMIREEIRNRVFHRIRHSRGKVERSLSLSWKDDHSQVANQNQKATIKRLATIGTVVLAFLLIIFNIQAYRAASSVAQQLEKIGLESPVTAYSQLIDRPIIERDGE